MRLPLQYRMPRDLCAPNTALDEDTAFLPKSKTKAFTSVLDTRFCCAQDPGICVNEADLHVPLLGRRHVLL